MNPGPLNHKKDLSNTFTCTFIFSTKAFRKYKNIFTSLHTQLKPKNIITIAYILYCIVIYFIILHIIFTFTSIHTLCLTTTRWSRGHKNEFPRGENLLSLQHSALGVPTWHTCLVSSRLFLWCHCRGTKESNHNC
jgi:hypothetical protein